MFITKFSLKEIQHLKIVANIGQGWEILLDCSLSAERDQYPQQWHGNCDLSILAFRLPKSSLVKNLAWSLRILLDIYGMERGTQYRNKTFRKPWSGHRVTYSSPSTCCGLGILYPSWSKLTIFLPSIRRYGEPHKKEKVKNVTILYYKDWVLSKFIVVVAAVFTQNGRK